MIDSHEEAGITTGGAPTPFLLPGPRRRIGGGRLHHTEVCMSQHPTEGVGHQRLQDGGRYRHTNATDPGLLTTADILHHHTDTPGPRTYPRATVTH